jgi:hypothetical protein
MPFRAPQILPLAAQSAPTKEDARHCYDSCSNAFETSFADANIQAHYENYRIQGLTVDILLLWTAIMAMLTADSTFGLYLLQTQYDAEDVIVVNIVLIGRVILGCMAMYVIFRISKALPADISLADLRQHTFVITSLTNAIIVGFSLVNGLMLCFQATKGSCEDAEEQHGFYDCNDSYETGGIPNGAVIYLFMTNIFIVTTLRCHHCWATRTSCVITILSIIVATFFTSKPVQSLLIILFACSIVVSARVLEKVSYTSFLAMLNLEMTKRDEAGELKHFIGNVAHDLKVLLCLLVVSKYMCL